jgi:hypothetical protein
VGDIVEIDRLGRRFNALVTGQAPDRACEVHTHWAKRGRPRTTDEPLKPLPLQLELDTTSRDPDLI